MRSVMLVGEVAQVGLDLEVGQVGEVGPVRSDRSGRTGEARKDQDREECDGNEQETPPTALVKRYFQTG